MNYFACNTHVAVQTCYMDNKYKCIDVQYDQKFCVTAVSILCLLSLFNFNTLLPRDVDDFQSGRFRINKNMLNFPTYAGNMFMQMDAVFDVRNYTLNYVFNRC